MCYTLTKKASWWFPNLGHFQAKLRVTICALVRRDVGIRPGYPQVIVPFIGESDRVPNHRASNHQLTTRWFKSSSVVCMISILMNITLSRPVPTIHVWTHSPSTAHPSNGPLMPGVLQSQKTCHDHQAPVSCIFGGRLLFCGLGGGGCFYLRAVQCSEESNSTWVWCI